MKKYVLPLFAVFITIASNAQDISRTFYPEQLKTDVNTLKAALTTLHPGLYKYNSKQQIETLFAGLYNKIKKPLHEKAFYLLLAKFTEKIGCGHTYLNPLNLEENIPALYMPKKVIPLCFVIINKKIIITHNMSADSGLKKGFEITAINGIAVSRIIDSLLLVSRADGKNAAGKKIANMQIVPEDVNKNTLTDIFLPLFFNAIKDDFIIETKSPDNKYNRIAVSGVTVAKRAVLYKNIFGKVPKGENALKTSLLNDSTGYLKAGTFSFFGSDNPFTKLIDSLFLYLSENKRVKNLIIDLRSNEGGSSEARNTLLSYVLPQNFEAKDYKERPFYSFLAIPEKLLPFLNTWDDRFFEPKPDSIFKKNEFGFYEDQSAASTGNKNFDDFAVKPNRFKGNIYLLTSPVNSSAAFEFAWVFKQYKAGTIVGEKTGGTKQGLNGGRFFFLRLPYSRIEVDLPFIYQAHIGQPDEGISPDYTVTASQEGIYKGEDTQLNFVLRLIDR
jgi:Peptidase family S41